MVNGRSEVCFPSIWLVVFRSNRFCFTEAVLLVCLVYPYVGRSCCNWLCMSVFFSSFFACNVAYILLAAIPPSVLGMFSFIVSDPKLPVVDCVSGFTAGPSRKIVNPLRPPPLHPVSLTFVCIIASVRLSVSPLL